MVEKRKTAVNAPSLTEQETKALQAFTRQAKNIYPTQIVRLALFGSKARGDSHPDSDLDVLVLVKEDDRTLRGDLIDLASEVSLNYDVLLSPRVIGETRWKTRQNFQLYRNIAREMVAL